MSSEPSKPFPASTAGRRIRKRRLIICSILAVGIFGIVCVWNFSATPVFSPGELSGDHSHLADSCQACHTAAHHGQTSARTDTNNRRDRRHLERELCSECHALGRFAHQPHSARPDKLARITARIRQVSTDDFDSRQTSSPGQSSADAVQGGLFCADCHREHQGRHVHLTHTSDAQCQSCHAKTFHGFDAHPEFSHYPYERRTRLYFDHATHYAMHFADFQRIMPDGEAPASCLTCHDVDQAGRHMLTRDFSASCASCHSRQIRDDIVPPFALFALPALDTSTLREKMVPIGQWPEANDSAAATIDELPVVMQLLLSSDDSFVEGRQKIGGLNLDFLDELTNDQLDALNDVVWAIKRLLYDVVRNGNRAVEKRLAAQLPDCVSSAELQELANTLPRQVVICAQQRWFPDLFAELQTGPDGEVNAVPIEDQPDEREDKPANPPQEINPSRAGWFLQDSDHSIRYQPSQHADRVLKIWLEVSALSSVEPETPANSAREDARSSYSSIRRVFSSLSTPTSVGRCMKCHTAEPNLQGGFQINWRAWRPTTYEHEFTQFTHLPHTTGADRERCTTCHRFQEQIVLRRPEFIHSDWTINTTSASSETSGFTPIGRQTCAECHKPKAVRDNCLTCHNYHIGQFERVDWSKRVGR